VARASSARPTLEEIGRGRFGYWEVVAYYDRAARILKKRLPLIEQPYSSIDVKISAYARAEKRYPNRLLDLTTIDVQKQAEEQFKKAGAKPETADIESLMTAIQEKFHFPVHLKGTDADCIKRDGTKAKVSIHFEIKFPAGSNPASFNRLKISDQVYQQLIEENVDQMPGKDIVGELHRELTEALNEQFDARVVQDYLLPEYFAELHPGRSAEENKELSSLYVRKVVREMQPKARGVISGLLKNFDLKQRHKFWMEFDKGLSRSEAIGFLKELLGALEAELDRYDCDSRTPEVVAARTRLNEAMSIALKIEPTSIMLAPVIDTEEKFDLLIKLVTADSEKLRPALAVKA
jgi:hypothetical protein